MIKVRHATRMIVNERDILACVDHPFITGLQYAFQDDQEVRRCIESGGALGGDSQLQPLPVERKPSRM
jgi:hypothetical protein